MKKGDDATIYLVGSAVATGFNKTVEELTAEEDTETEEITETETAME